MCLQLHLLLKFEMCCGVKHFQVKYDCVNIIGKFMQERQNVLGLQILCIIILHFHPALD